MQNSELAGQGVPTTECCDLAGQGVPTTEYCDLAGQGVPSTEYCDLAGQDVCTPLSIVILLVRVCAHR